MTHARDLADEARNVKDSLSPSGMISPFAMAAAPTGWLVCNGSAVSRTTYADLFAVIGTTWGAGNGSSTFTLPDLRGAFLRGTGSHGTSNMANGSDFAGPSVGSFENDQMQGHRHSFTFSSGNNGNTVFGSTSRMPSNDNTGNQLGRNDGSDANNTIINAPTALTDGTPREGDETRPFNAGVNYCIKT